MPDKRTFILGSSSKWRAQVLQRLGIAFETMSPDIDEKSIRAPEAAVMTYLIAEAKAEALLERVSKPALIVCADQVVVFDGEVREKPRDVDEARRWLRGYSGKSVETVTAVSVADVSTRVISTGTDTATVRFKEIDGPAIAYAIARGDVLDSCGAFTIDDPALVPIVDRIDGEFESVQGLPVRLLRELLRDHGYRLP